MCIRIFIPVLFILIFHEIILLFNIKIEVHYNEFYIVAYYYL